MDTEQTQSVLRSRLAAVEARLQAACQRAGRPRSDITLIAVTKTIPAAIAALLPDLGVLELGENRPQALWEKAAAIPHGHWHLIGHLQRNKIERTLPLTTLIHSVDSVRLLEALEKEGTRQQRTVRILLEVNVSREANKHGFAPEEIAAVVQSARTLRQVVVSGLMTMAAYAEDPEAARPTFRELRQIRERFSPLLEPPHHFRELSMGMTNDFEVAVEEGATLVRIGTALFAGLDEGTS